MMKLTKTKLKQIIREEIQKQRLDEKHPKIPDLDDYIELTRPYPSSDYDWDDEDYYGPDPDDEIERIEKKAKQMGVFDDLMRASTIAHYGRGNNERDMFGDFKSDMDHKKYTMSLQKRFKKDGKLTKAATNWLKKNIKYNLKKKVK